MNTPEVSPDARDMKACRRLLGVPLRRARDVCEYLYDEQPVSACEDQDVPVPADEDLRETYRQALEAVEAEEYAAALEDAHEQVLLKRCTRLTVQLQDSRTASCVFGQTLEEFIEQVEAEADGVMLVRRWRKQTLGSRLAASLLDACHQRFDFEGSDIWYARPYRIKCLTIEPTCA